MAESPPTASVRVSVVGMTDVGKVREHNEDSFLVLDRDSGTSFPSGKVHEGELRSGVVLVVCDGMGGAAAGEVASRMAIERMSAELAKADLTAAAPDQVATLMDDAVQKANQEIFAKAKSDTEHRGMGTTLTAAVVTPGRVFVSQVGDSRAYLVRKGFLNQLTKDQSLVGQLVEEGTLTEEEAEKIGAKNIVLQAVGNEDTLRVDTKHWPLLRGDVLLLCSDGLSGMVKDARMREIVNGAGDDLHAAADQLIAEANKNGGRDNITVILARFDGDGLRAPLETDAKGTLETAGASFKAPPPPEVANPMKKVALWGAIVLAVIAAVSLSLWSTTARLVGTVAPPGAKVVLKQGGATVREVTVTADGKLELPDVPVGDYEIDVSADRYGGFHQDVPVKSPGRVVLDPISLRPNPGKLVLVAVERVQVAVSLTPAHPTDREDPNLMGKFPAKFELAAGDENKSTLENVAAGTLRVTASREGFRDFDESHENGPQFDLTVRIPKLVERKGTLVVRGAAGGSLRVVTTTGDVLLEEPEVKEPVWEHEVRAVPVRVTVTRKNYRIPDEAATVSEGGRAEVTMHPQALKVSLQVRATADWTVALERQDPATNAWVPVDEVVAVQGVARFGSVEPGKYKATAYERKPTSADRSLEFEIAAGDPDCTKDLVGK